MKKHFVKYPLIVGVMALLFFAGQAWGADFYLRADGEAAIGETTGCGSAAAASNVTAHNAATFSGDDVIYLCDGTYADRITAPSSGTSGHLITYKNASGASPIIDVAGTLSAAFYSNGKDFIKVEGIHFKNATGAQIYFYGVCDGVQIVNNISTGGVHGIFFSGGTGAIITGNTINQGSQSGMWLYSGLVSPSVSGNNFVGVSGKTYTNAFHAGYAENLIYNSNTITDWSMDNGGTAAFFEYTSFTGTGNVVTYTEYPATIVHGFYALGCATTGFSGTAYQTTGNGFLVDTCTSGMVFNDIEASYCKLAGVKNIGASVATFNRAKSHHNSTGSENDEVHGIQTADSAVVILNECQTYFNKGDGVNGNGTGSITCNRGKSYSNGATGNSSSGDGFTTHDTCALYLKNCIGYGNFKSGVAVVGTGNGSIYNSTFYNNYDASQSGNYGIFLNSSGTWVVENNITANHEYEIYTGASATGSLTIDYNDYYASRGLNAYSWGGAAATDFAGWKTASSQDSHSINSNPLFADAANGNFRIRGPARTGSLPIWTYAEWLAAGGDFYGKYPTGGTLSTGAAQFQKKLIDDLFDEMILKRSKSTDAGSYVQP